MKHWLDGYSFILCDLDGCIISGQELLPGAMEFCDQNRDRLIILSNNSSDTPASLAERLHKQNLEIEPERVLLAGTTTLDLLADQKPGSSIKIFGSDLLKDYAVSLDLKLSYSNPEIIVLTRDTQFSYRTLNEIVGKISRGAELWVSNLDDSHPGSDGIPVAETGALLNAISTCVPDVTYKSVGKPSNYLYEVAKKRFGIDPADAIAIGDNPNTDMNGAKKNGLDYVILDSSGSGFGPENLFQLIEHINLHAMSSYPGVSIRLEN